MKKIELSSLAAGTSAGYEYFSKDGKLLIARGVLLTQGHLDTLIRNNVKEVYIDGEDHLVNEVLAADYSAHHAALFFNGDVRQFLTSSFDLPLGDRPWQRPLALDLPEFKSIGPGEQGFRKLVESKAAARIDTGIAAWRPADETSGIALKGQLRQMTAKDRSDDYRKKTVATYYDLLLRTRTLLDSLADGNRQDDVAARSIVEQTLKILMIDMCYLLNITLQRYSPDTYIYNHSLNVCIYSLCIAVFHGLNQRQAIEVGIGALLHDTGMLLVPREIFLKNGKLDKDEWYEIMKHPVFGIHLLEKIDRLPEVVPFMAYQCHERENGKGYPRQRSGRLIHSYAKICAVADMYEAFSSARPYRSAVIPYKALEFVIKASQQGLVSREHARALVQCLSLFPMGSIVELSNHAIGKVIKASASSPAKPVVCLMFDENGAELSGGANCEIDLMTTPALSIVKAHPNDYREIPWLGGF